MTRANLTVIVLLMLGCSGCAAPLARFEAALEEAGVARFAARAASDGSVEVRATLDANAKVGRGAIVGDRWVLTVEHVLQGRDSVFVSTTRDGGWVEAKVVRREAADPEPMVLLEVAVDEGAYGALLGFDGFGADTVLSPGVGGLPSNVVTARGLLTWGPGVLAPGDSGAPVLDDAGRLVGLVSGRRGDVGVYVAVRHLPGRQGVLLASR